MPKTVKRTAVATYDDGSEGVLTISKLTPISGGEPFMVIDTEFGNDSIVVGTADQAKQLTKAIRAVSREIWDQ